MYAVDASRIKEWIDLNNATVSRFWEEVFGDQSMLRMRVNDLYSAPQSAIRLRNISTQRSKALCRKRDQNL